MNTLRFYSAALLLLLATSAALAQKSAVFAPAGKAINGYDPVAYFTEKKPVMGDPKFSYDWQGATWTFATAKNRDAFKAQPEQYAPQYGGYCAFGLARGYKAPTEPDAWTIDDGKLYLNYNLKVREDWDRDRKTYIQKADQNWPQVKNAK